MSEEMQNNTEPMINPAIITKVSLYVTAGSSTGLIVVISPLAGLQHIIAS